MAHSGFVPLRVFSSYTMLDGAIDPKAIAKRARELGFPAAALTDRNGLYAAMAYSDACFSSGDYLVFGRETAGLPEQICSEAGDRWLRIPMFHDKARSLNLANCVALVLYEALRQSGFQGEL